MKSGRLRDKITFQTYAESLTESGGLVKAWTDFAIVFAEILPVSGREYIAASQVQGEISHKIRIRYLSGLHSKMRIVSGLRTFEIVAILPDRTNAREIIILANEKGV